MQQRQARTLLPGQVRDLLLARPSQPPSAEEMLLSGGLTVTETAQRLGYLELSSFSQASRRWNGMGPRAYRGARSGARG